MSTLSSLYFSSQATSRSSKSYLHTLSARSLASWCSWLVGLNLSESSWVRMYLSPLQVNTKSVVLRENSTSQRKQYLTEKSVHHREISSQQRNAITQLTLLLVLYWLLLVRTTANQILTGMKSNNIHSVQNIRVKTFRSETISLSKYHTYMICYIIWTHNINSNTLKVFCLDGSMS